MVAKQPHCPHFPDCCCEEDCEQDLRRIERLLRQPLLGLVDVALAASFVLGVFAVFVGVFVVIWKGII